MRTCATCGAPRSGPYCHACGQASPEAQRSFGEVLSGQTGRLLHTLRNLLLRPGELAREIDEGRDRRSLRPLTLLLNLIALFFLLGGGAGGFSAKLFLESDPSGRGATLLAERSQSRGLPQLVVEERLEQRFRSVYSALVVVQAFAYGCAIGVVERRRRKAWLVHFGAAIHYMCVSFLVASAGFGIGRLTGYDIGHSPLVGAVMYMLLLAYMSLMLHRAYADPPPLAVGKALLVLLFGYGVAVALSTAAVLVAVVTT